MAASGWDPGQYRRFRDERTQPFLDLLALVEPAPGMRALDLGCGTGELTRMLHERLQARETLGLDSSPEMLRESAAFAGAGLGFEHGDIATFAAPGPYDLVFSNAALHWVPEHPVLFPRLAAILADGGQLAVQMPANFDEPSHTVAREVAAEAPFRDVLGARLVSADVLSPSAYAVLLARLGFRAQHVRLQVYLHRLAGREEVVEWVKGSLLADYRRRLPADLYDRFLARYRERLLARLEDTHPYLFPFKRILLWASR